MYIRHILSAIYLRLDMLVTPQTISNVSRHQKLTRNPTATDNFNKMAETRRFD